MYPIKSAFVKEKKGTRNYGILLLKQVSMGLCELAMTIKWGSKAKTDLPHAATYKFCKKLADRGERVPNIAFAGGFSSEDHLFAWLAKILPDGLRITISQKIVREFGTTIPEIFVCYEEVGNMVGKDKMKNIPLGALGIYSYSQKIKVGLQQLMADAQCFNIKAITRNELMSLT